ncbi:hypothetical protein [Streptomyces lasiicapitis]|uniref:hypothetical protein n=1 Tax=Streptomyces lasiicapitis TaxID=1923961 RepID=UPI0036B473C4
MYESYTPRENRKRVGLTFRAIRRGFSDADMDDLERKRDRLVASAQDRGTREVEATLGELERCRNAVAQAEARWRTAKGPDRSAARKRVNDEKKALKHAEHAAKTLLR